MKTTCWHGITKVGPSNDWQNKTKPDFAPQFSGSISLQIRHEPKQRLILKHMITALEPQLQCAFKCASQLCLQCNMHKPQLFKCYWQLQVLRWSTFLIKNIPALVFITFIVIVAKLPLLNIYILSYFSEGNIKNMWVFFCCNAFRMLTWLPWLRYTQIMVSEEPNWLSWTIMNVIIMDICD